MGNLWLGVIMLIPFTRRTAVCTSKASRENCVTAQQYISAISTNGIFSQASILSNSGAERRRWEHYQMCLSSSTPVGGTYIEWPFLHGSLILTQSPRLITMGTFHRVLDLINDFFRASISLLPSPSFSPIPSCPAPLVFPAPEPITRPPQGPGLHNHVSSRPSYSSRIA